MHFISEQFTKKYGRHSGFSLRICYQLYHCHQLMNLFQHQKLQEIKTMSHISGHGCYTCYALFVSHIRVEIFFIVYRHNVTNLVSAGKDSNLSCSDV
jgi:hypothetical protein